MNPGPAWYRNELLPQPGFYHQAARGRREHNATHIPGDSPADRFSAIVAHLQWLAAARKPAHKQQAPSDALRPASPVQSKFLTFALFLPRYYNFQAQVYHVDLYSFIDFQRIGRIGYVLVKKVFAHEDKKLGY